MRVSANGISIEVEEHGSASGEPLLLVMGLGMQLIAWPEGFVEQLVQRGFRVIRFDNRDIGLSESFDAHGVPNLALDALRFAVGLRVASPYSLADMAADSVGVLDALGIARAHDATLQARLGEAPPVPTTSIYSRSDGIVSWRCSLNERGPLAENIEVHASHVGMGLNPLALYAIGDRLAQPIGQWQPFEARGVRRWFFPAKRATPAEGLG